MTPNSAKTAVGLYAVMARDTIDALEMIQECLDIEALQLLLDMLLATGTARTDTTLNALFVEPVKRRLASLGDPP
jgi:hypothetical protein